MTSFLTDSFFPWTVCNGHSRDEPVRFNDIYLAYISLQDNADHKKYHLYSADGKHIGKTVTEEYREQVRAFDTNNVPYRSIDYIFGASHTDEGYPIVVFRYKKQIENSNLKEYFPTLRKQYPNALYTTPNVDSKDTTRYLFEVNAWCSRWNGETWQSSRVEKTGSNQVQNLHKNQKGFGVILTDFDKNKQFYSSTDGGKNWSHKKTIHLNRSLRNWSALQNNHKDLIFITSHGQGSHDLNYNEPCYVYGNIPPQLLSYYTFDVENQHTVIDSGLYRVNGLMKLPERASGLKDNAFISTTSYLNNVQFPHSTGIHNDFSVEFWLKTDFSKLSKYAHILGITSEDQDIEVDSEWKIDYNPKVNAINFVIIGENGQKTEVKLRDLHADYNNDWIKLTTVFRPENVIEILVNDELKASAKTSIGSIIYNTNKLQIGSDGFFGMLDEIKIYDGIIIK